MKAVSVFPKGILLTVCLEAASIVAGVLSHSRSHLSQYMMAVSLNIAVVFLLMLLLLLVFLLLLLLLLLPLLLLLLLLLLKLLQLLLFAWLVILGS